MVLFTLRYNKILLGSWSDLCFIVAFLYLELYFLENPIKIELISDAQNSKIHRKLSTIDVIKQNESELANIDF